MKRTLLIIVFLLVASSASAKSKARFYDFSDQLIDGNIKKPSTIFMESRVRAKFNKLLKLKKSFVPRLLMTGHEPSLK